MDNIETLLLTRDCDAIQIPSGFPVHLTQGTEVRITQSLGDAYTVVTATNGLVRIEGKDADALNLTPTAQQRVQVEGTLEETVWAQLRTVFDPEIPVDIVNLGLVYDCQVSQVDSKTSVTVRMTLTAPGCGMGPVIAATAKARVLAISGVDEAQVELVWDPPWNQSMITQEGRMKLGML